MIDRPHAVWAWDFAHDVCANGQKLKIPTVVDEYTRRVLALDVACRIDSRRVAEVLDYQVFRHGAPRCLRSDNAPELACRVVLKWLEEAGIEAAFITPGKPWENG